MKMRILFPGKNCRGYSLLQSLLETLCVLLVILGFTALYINLMKNASKILEDEKTYIQTENAEVMHEIGR
jgi:hypothetical protein